MLCLATVGAVRPSWWRLDPHMAAARRPQKASTSAAGCWVVVDGSLELLGNSIEEEDRCQLRFTTLYDARVACEAMPACGGVTRDNGMACTGSARPRQFELRSGAVDLYRGEEVRRLVRRVGRRSNSRSVLLHRPRPNMTADSFSEWCSAKRTAGDRQGSRPSLPASRPVEVLDRDGTVTRGVPRPRHAGLAVELMGLVGDGVVLELVRNRRDGRGGEATGGEATPPYSLLHQRVPPAWRGGSAWRARALPTGHMTGRFVGEDEVCSLPAPPSPSDWLVAIDGWPGRCDPNRTVAALHPSIVRGVVVASERLVDGFAAAGFVVDGARSAQGRELLRGAATADRGRAPLYTVMRRGGGAAAGVRGGGQHAAGRRLGSTSLDERMAAIEGRLDRWER